VSRGITPAAGHSKHLTPGSRELRRRRFGTGSGRSRGAVLPSPSVLTIAQALERGARIAVSAPEGGICCVRIDGEGVVLGTWCASLACQAAYRKLLSKKPMENAAISTSIYFMIPIIRSANTWRRNHPYISHQSYTTNADPFPQSLCTTLHLNQHPTPSHPSSYAHYPKKQNQNPKH
jgi:hypothetical protein